MRLQSIVRNAICAGLLDVQRCVYREPCGRAKLHAVRSYPFLNCTKISQYIEFFTHSPYGYHQEYIATEWAEFETLSYLYRDRFHCEAIYIQFYNHDHNRRQRHPVYIQDRDRDKVGNVILYRLYIFLLRSINILYVSYKHQSHCSSRKT